MTLYPRIGHGIDVHRFGEGDHVTLAGVEIPHERGLVAHSDGDVALHALADALLGALALGDIGKHFPDTGALIAGAGAGARLSRWQCRYYCAGRAAQAGAAYPHHA